MAKDGGGDARLDAALRLPRAFGLDVAGTQAAPPSAYAGADPFGGVYPSVKLFTERAKRQAARAAVEGRLRDEGAAFDWERGVAMPESIASWLATCSRRRPLFML